MATTKPKTIVREIKEIEETFKVRRAVFGLIRWFEKQNSTSLSSDIVIYRDPKEEPIRYIILKSGKKEIIYKSNQ